MATMCPRACSALTMFSLCSGETRAYTDTSSTTASSSSAVMLSRSVPVSRRSPCAMPSSCAMVSAVSGWSPVIITGRTPAARAVATAAAASGRGGSIRPTIPRKISSLSAQSHFEPFCPATSSGRAATPSTRSPSAAWRSFSARISRRRSSVRGRTSPPDHAYDATPSRWSTAPLANANACAPPKPGTSAIVAGSPPSTRWTVVMRLRSDENGTSPIRGSVPSSAARSTPARCAASSSAPSVGSPTISNALPSAAG